MRYFVIILSLLASDQKHADYPTAQSVIGTVLIFISWSYGRLITSYINIYRGVRMSSIIFSIGPLTLPSRRYSVISDGSKMSMIENIHALAYLVRWLWE